MVELYVGDEFLCDNAINARIKVKTQFNYRKLLEQEEGRLLLTAPIFDEDRYFVMDYTLYTQMAKSGFPFGSLPKSTHLFIYVSEFTTKTVGKRFVEKHKLKIIKCPKLTERTASQWIRSMCLKAKVQISTEAIRLIIDALGVDAKSLYEEVKKLKSLTDSMITKQAVLAYTVASREFNVFEISNFILQRKFNSAFRVYSYVVRSGDPFTILRYLQNFYMNLITAKISIKILPSNYLRMRLANSN